MQDSKIIDLFFERSEQAITELSLKYEKLCKKIAVNILGNEEDSLECINDSYLVVWNTVPPKKPENLKYYLCRIVRNNALKRFHSNSAVKRNSYYDVALQELEECIPDKNSIEIELTSAETTKIIDSFLEAQKQENRVIFTRRYFFGDSIGDIAERVGISENNVSVKLNRMRKNLRNHLEKEGIEI